MFKIQTSFFAKIVETAVSLYLKMQDTKFNIFESNIAILHQL